MFSPCLCEFPPGAPVSSRHQNMHVRHIRLGWPKVAARSVAAAQEEPLNSTRCVCVASAPHYGSRADLFQF